MAAERIGPYRIEGLLGRGGMGEVYRAWDEKLHRHVAIKLVHAQKMGSETLARFLHEARTAAQLDHPAIVRIYHVEEVDGDECIVMELIEGQSLARLLSDGPLGTAEALAIARQVASGLAAAHAKSIVHRDLKTENVMVTPDGQAKVLDFGLALLHAGSGPDEDEGELAGTPRAMSPEQVHQGRADHRSDLFSFGTLLYEMLTGQPPFTGRTPVAVLDQVAFHHPPPVHEWNPEVPAELSRLVLHLHQKSPADRPPDAAWVLARLDELALPTTAGWAARLPRVHDERRQLTVVHVVAPPGAAGVRALERAAQAVTARLGTVRTQIPSQAQVPGRLVACFGCSGPREDDARRAVEAARDALAAAPPEGGLGVAVHTGIARSPQVAASEVEDEDGDPWELAAELARRAPKDDVWLSATTRRLVAGTFLADGPEAVPGLPDPAFRLRGLIDRRGAWPRGELATLVGRGEELAFLEEKLALAERGEGQVVLVGGEPGIGKSHLLGAFAEHLGLGPESLWVSRSSPQSKNAPLRPVVALLWQVLATGRGASPEENLARLRELLVDHRLPGEWLALLAALLGLGAAPAGHLSTAGRKKRTLAAVAELVLALADSEPRLWMVEDLHWIDPDSLGLLDLLVDQVPSSRLMLVSTYRSAWKPPWEPRADLTTLVLRHLGAEPTRELIARTAGRALPPLLVERIAERTDGVPLFVEELTKLVLESDVVREEDGRFELGDAEHLFAVPTNLRDALMARLDRLGPGKQVAQLVAVFGRAVEEDLLAAVAPFDAEVLAKELDRLVAAGLLVRRGVARVKVVFKHFLIQQAAYASLTEARRREVHAEIAAALEGSFAELGRRRPEAVAHHKARARGDGMGYNDEA